MIASVTFFLLIILLLGGCSNIPNAAQHQNNKTALEDNSLLYLTIGNPKSTTQDAARAIQELGDTIDETAAFWNDIANDESFSTDLRREAVIQLFRRHIRVGMTIGELADLIHTSGWLRESNINLLGIIGGYVPVHVVAGDTIVVLSILPQSGKSEAMVFLRIRGRIDISKLNKILLGDIKTDKIIEATLAEIGSSEVNSFLTQHDRQH